jgi:hypothetical protein
MDEQIVGELQENQAMFVQTAQDASRVRRRERRRVGRW